MLDPEKIGNILGQETVKEIYKDGLAEPLKETSKIAVDLIKTLRLFTAPFQLGAAFQDRLSRYLDQVRTGVPAENQVDAPPSLAGPIIEKLKYLEEDNYLIDLYLNLLARSIDKERINEAHPAFKIIIDQLSPDEAVILKYLNEDEIFLEYSIDHVSFYEHHGKFPSFKVELITIPNEELVFEQNLPIYLRHLESLNLIEWPDSNRKPVYKDKQQISEYIHSKLLLTEFGKLFCKACIPK